MIFRPYSRSREHCPIIVREAIGRAIELSDQLGALRVLPGDRLRMVEDRGDHALCEHSACKLGVLLVQTQCLAVEAPLPPLEPLGHHLSLRREDEL
jgi:hypothetical protein